MSILGFIFLLFFLMIVSLFFAGGMTRKGKVGVIGAALTCGFVSLICFVKSDRSSRKEISNPEIKTTGAATTRKPKNSWSYFSSKDDMTEVKMAGACIDSDNSLTFNFPYDGGSQGTLCIGRNSKGTRVMLSVSKGQFLCVVDRCKVAVKFDDAPIQSFHGAEERTGAIGRIFVEPGPKFLASLLKAKKVRIGADFFQEGQGVLFFDVEGLDPKSF